MKYLFLGGIHHRKKIVTDGSKYYYTQFINKKNIKFVDSYANSDGSSITEHYNCSNPREYTYELIRIVDNGISIWAYKYTKNSNDKFMQQYRTYSDYNRRKKYRKSIYEMRKYMKSTEKQMTKLLSIPMDYITHE